MSFSNNAFAFTLNESVSKTRGSLVLPRPRLRMYRRRGSACRREQMFHYHHSLFFKKAVCGFLRACDRPSLLGHVNDRRSLRPDRVGAKFLHHVLPLPAPERVFAVQENTILNFVCQPCGAEILPTASIALFSMDNKRSLTNLSIIRQNCFLVEQTENFC